MFFLLLVLEGVDSNSTTNLIYKIHFPGSGHGPCIYFDLLKIKRRKKK